DRTAPQRLDSALLADRSREEDKGRIRRFGLGDPERGETIEAGQGEIRENDVGLESRECRAKARLGVRPVVNAADTAPRELLYCKIGVDADVLDDQHTQAVQLQVARHSCPNTGWSGMGICPAQWRVSPAGPSSGCTCWDYCTGEARYLTE